MPEQLEDCKKCRGKGYFKFRCSTNNAVLDGEGTVKTVKCGKCEGTGKVPLPEYHPHQIIGEVAGVTLVRVDGSKF